MDELDLLREMVAECMELLHALIENPNEQARRRTIRLLEIHNHLEVN